MSEPIVVDIGGAVATLEASPELAERMMQLVAPLVADQLNAAERLRVAVVKLCEQVDKDYYDEDAFAEVFRELKDAAGITK